MFKIELYIHDRFISHLASVKSKTGIKAQHLGYIKKATSDDILSFHKKIQGGSKPSVK